MNAARGGASENFQVDLHGVVDLLSHHLYSGPRVYIRELLQNAVDAITARRLTGPDAPAHIAITVDEAGLTIDDTGIGLTPEQVVQLLATIGRSSKRDEIGFAREEFLGQFGIGLLSAFMVADELVVHTRPVNGSTTQWIGTADGTYRVTAADDERADIGTTVHVRPRPGTEKWVHVETVKDLVRLFGSKLPFTVEVNGEVMTHSFVPWDRSLPRNERQAELVGYAQDTLGFTPFDIIDLHVPEAGLTGVAFVLPFTANPATRSVHRVYLKRMLLSESADGLVPDWAFFVRCVVDTSNLRPTASREALYEEPELDVAREALGDQIRRWMVRLGRTNPDRLMDFLRIHHLGVKVMALDDDEMLELVYRWVPFQTNQGRMSVEEIAGRADEVRYATSVDEFRQVAAVAAAQGIVLVNAGYTYDTDLLERMAQHFPALHVSPFEASDITTSLDTLAPADELAMRPLVTAAQTALESVDCEVVLREFQPSVLPALYLIDRDATFAAQMRETQGQVDQLWAEVLGALDAPTDARPQLVLNYASPLVRRLAGVSDPRVLTLAVEGLYGHALMQGHHPITAADSVIVNRSFLGLLEVAMPTVNGSDS